MQDDLVRKIRALVHYCDHLARELMDPGLKRTFSDAARFFDDQSVLIEEEVKRRTALHVNKAVGGGHEP